MKKLLLSACIIIACCVRVVAQPILTAATLNPVPTEVFYGHSCDVTGITPGAAGASVTWNFAGLTELNRDTTTLLACSPSFHCDSFPGSNFVMYDNYDDYYGIADTSKLVFTGAYISSQYLHLHGESMILFYPATYNSVHVDSYSYNIPFVDAYREIDSFIGDGYGTLILPTGTFTNVLRIHEIGYVWDTSAFGGTSVYRTESYNWYMTGFHHQLLVVNVDTTMPGGPYTSNAEYYTQGVPLAVRAVGNTTDVLVYPNPAADVIHAKFSLPENVNARVTLSDVTGRVVAAIGANGLKQGMNDVQIPLSGIPAGLYMMKIDNGSESVYRKVVVSH
jgi:hypothetical protein